MEQLEKSILPELKQSSKPKQSKPVKQQGKRNKMETTNLERENLEAHVDLCAERYKQLESRLTIIEAKVSELGRAIAESKDSMSKTIIGASATIVSSLLALIVTILLKF
jgi:chromosome segregation ATPase